MRIVSWNINGLRAILKKNFCGSVQKISPDILCLQETRVDTSSMPAIELDGFTKFFNSAEKRGYSGTALFSKIQPINISTNTEIDALIAEAIPRDNQRWNQMQQHAQYVNNMKNWLQLRTDWLNQNIGSYDGCSDVDLPPLVISKIHTPPSPRFILPAKG